MASDDPAVAPRPKAVGGMGMPRSMGGRDVAPIGTSLQVPRALPVGILPAVASRPSLGVARGRVAVGGQVVEQRTGGQDVAPIGKNARVPQALPVGLHGHPSWRLIVALDTPTLPAALRLATRVAGVVRDVKVGSILFTACGPEAVRRLRRLGFSVMLDLKWHDIPSTVALSCRAAVRLGINRITVHASGGAAMLRAAVQAVREEARRRRGVARPRVLAVTVLTSDAGASRAAVTANVLRLARTALAAGCDGVVASAQEAAALRARFGARCHIVCPGIRPAWAARGDQHRIATPAAALRAGADALVVGRPITAARDPRAAAQRILEEMRKTEC